VKRWNRHGEQAADGQLAEQQQVRVCEERFQAEARNYFERWPRSITAANSLIRPARNRGQV
jgi:hypothetical protein